jgi:hypothetical protein
VKLRAKHGVPARIYDFKEMRYTGHNGNDYSQSSIRGCRTIGSGWKPVCDHPSYCRNDSNSIYLGNTAHLSNGGHWNNNYLPGRLLSYKNAFRQDHMCY